MKDLLGRTTAMLACGAEVVDIFQMLTGEGLSAYEAWLTYMGAALILKQETQSWP